MTDNEQKVYDCLYGDCYRKALLEIAGQTGIGVQSTFAALQSLVAKGLIRQAIDMCYECISPNIS